MKKFIMSLVFALTFVLPVQADTTCEHVWSDWEIVYDSTCDQNGLEYRNCQNCNADEYQKIELKEHTWGDWSVEEEPNCTYTGLEVRECLVCFESEEHILEVDTEVHDFSDWYTSKRATALKAGQKTRECWDCGYEDTKTINKLKASVSLKKKSITINKKGSYTLKIKSKTYGDKIRKWKSKNPKVATVNSKGKVTGKKAGTTTIILYMKSGVKASCKVKVRNKTESSSKSKATSSSGYVWIPRTGEKYHKSSGCSNMKNPSKVSLSEAKRLGYTACKKCYR